MSEHMSLEEYRAQLLKGGFSPDHVKTMVKNKFGAVKKEKGGQTFHSSGEADRHADLLLMQEAGEIENLRTQVEYALVVNHMLICRYIADFVYLEKNGKIQVEIVEDFKSEATRKLSDYAIKKKLMLAVYGIKIRETSRAKSR